jgi:GTPase SAR1 family protein
MIEVTTPLKNPFRVLDSFDKSDHRSFHGRDTEIKDLHALLVTTNMVLVFGESGVGKTSLVWCTLAKKFNDDDYLPVLVRRGTNMMDSLRSCLEKRLSNSTIAAIKSSEAAELPLYKLVTEVYNEYFKPVYLIFDQFEDVYIFGTPEERKDFYEDLEFIVESKLNCKVIIVIREDYHGALQDLERRLPGLYRRGLKIFPLKKEFACTNIIEHYLDTSGVTIAGDKTDISGMIADSCTPPGQSTIFLPYLGVFLYKLWERAYNLNRAVIVFNEGLVREIGKIGNVLRGYVSDVVDEIAGVGNAGESTDDDNEPERAQAIQIWGMLQEFIEDDSKKSAMITEIFDHVPYEVKKDWAEKLKERRILNEFLHKDQYELAHQSLVAIILERKSTTRQKLVTPVIEGNPYKGLLSYNPEDSNRFFGREKVADDLFKKVCNERLVVVVGISGTGKSSLVKAGVIPKLAKEGYDVFSIRPDTSPSASLRQVEAFLETKAPKDKFLLYVDQFEELSTRCDDLMQRKEFIKFIKDVTDPYSRDSRFANAKVLLSVRGDFESEFENDFPQWIEGKFNVPKFLEADFRRAIVEPAYLAGLEFKPSYLVDVMISEVLDSNALPLLSYTLSELYSCYERSKRKDCFLTETDYKEIGGVRGSLGKRADKIYHRYGENDPMRTTIRNVMLRMTSIDFNAERAGKPVLVTELHFNSAEENKRVKKVLQEFIEARLIVTGRTPQSVPTFEPAHDSLVRTWGKIGDWVRQYGPDIIYLQGRLRDAVRDYKTYGSLWHDNKDLGVLETQMEKGNWFNKLEMEFIQASLYKRKELSDLREREKELTLTRKTSRIWTLAMILVIILVAAVAVIIDYSKRGKELSSKIEDLYRTNILLENERKESANLAQRATNARIASEADRGLALKAQADAQVQKERAQTEAKNAKASLGEVQVITTRLKDAYDSVKFLQYVTDSTLTAFKILERKRKNAERLGGWLQLIDNNAEVHPVLAYRIAERAHDLEPDNIQVLNWIDKLSALSGYVPAIEIPNTQFSAYSNTGKMFLTVNSDTLNIWNIDGTLRNMINLDEGEHRLPFAQFSKSDRYVMYRNIHRMMVVDLTTMQIVVDRATDGGYASFTWSPDEFLITIRGSKIEITDFNGNEMRRGFEASDFIGYAQSDGNRVFIETDESIVAYDTRTTTRPVTIVKPNDAEGTFVLPRAQGCVRVKDGAIHVTKNNSFEWDTYPIKGVASNAEFDFRPLISRDNRKIYFSLRWETPKPDQVKNNLGDNDGTTHFLYVLNLDDPGQSIDYTFIKADEPIARVSDISIDGQKVLAIRNEKLDMYQRGSNGPIFTFNYPIATASFNPSDDTSFMARSGLREKRAFIFIKGNLGELKNAGRLSSFAVELKKLGVE